MQVTPEKLVTGGISTEIKFTKSTDSKKKLIRKLSSMFERKSTS